MKVKTGLIVCCVSLLLIVPAAVSSQDRPSANGTSRLPAKGTIDFSNYDTEDLVTLMVKIRKSHRLEEAEQVGREALARGLTAEQDALVRHEMAYVCEFLPGGGPLARERHEEILELHPNYKRIAEVALRLGQLYDSTILPGTERNYARAIECYRYVVEKCVDPNDPAVYVDVMQAHMHLGDLYAQQRDYRPAKRHYEAIYNCDPNMVAAPPWKTFERPEDVADHKRWARGRIAGLKGVIPHHLVSTCIKPRIKQTEDCMQKLLEKYADDPEIVRLATDALTRQRERNPMPYRTGTH